MPQLRFVHPGAIRLAPTVTTCALDREVGQELEALVVITRLHANAITVGGWHVDVGLDCSGAETSIVSAPVPNTAIVRTMI